MVQFFALLGQDSERKVGAVEITADCKTLCIAVGCEFRKCESRGRRKHPVASCEDKERIKEPDAPWRRTVFVVAAARRTLVRLEIGLEGA